MSSTTRRDPPAMTNTAKLLGISADQLDSDLQSGQTLSSFASTAGISSSDLPSSVETDLKTSAPQGAPTLTTDQLQQRATNLINDDGPMRAQRAQVRARPQPFQSLSSTLGVDPDDLLSRAQGGDLGDLLQSSGTGYGSSDTGSLTNGLLYDRYH